MKYRCENCDCLVELDRQFPDIPGLHLRIGPGGIVPAGTCIHCQALVYNLSPSDHAEQLNCHLKQCIAILPVLEELEWSADVGVNDSECLSCCPTCRSLKRDGHATSCGLAAAIATLRDASTVTLP